MVLFKGKEFVVFPRRFGFFPYIFLLYVTFPIYSLTKETGIKQLLGFAMILLFLVTYRQLYTVTSHKSFSIWLAIQLSIIFIYCLLYDINYLFLGFFPANFIGWFPNKKLFKLGFAGLLFVELVPFFYHVLLGQVQLTSSELLYFVPFMIIMFISPFGIRSMNKRMDLEKQLDQANQQIKELVKREERVRIARDLHDTLGHTLSLFTLKAQLVQRLIEVDSERAKMEAKEMEQTSRAALKQVRELVTDMRAATIAEELLDIQQILQAAGIRYHISGTEDSAGTMSTFTENVLCMCMKEAATNIVKHSKAKNCFLSIQKEVDQFKVIIRDDGMGLKDVTEYGNGLNGMKERLDLIEGSLSLTNYNGAIVELTVPIVEKVKKEGIAL
ncbi:histidine kinase [Neobacillus sp. D3-1R]|uniref:sensor histidine kinase n=1 Tax=Neobacillus sp. D3-1R TaxID=3445778 RepID=UPI003FA15157